MTEATEASCLCGGVRYRLARPAGEITACHCGQCRKTSGHYAASFDVEAEEIVWLARETLAEHRLPSGALRTFCGTCGCRVGFRSASGDWSLEAGLVATPTGGHLAGHIFTADKGDYYAIADGLPQEEGA